MNTFVVGKFYRLKESKTTFVKVLSHHSDITGKFVKVEGFDNGKWYSSGFEIMLHGFSSWEEMYIPKKHEYLAIGKNDCLHKFIAFDHTLPEPYIFKSMKKRGGVFSVGSSAIRMEPIYVNPQGEEFYASDFASAVHFLFEDKISSKVMTRTDVQMYKERDPSRLTPVFKTKKQLFIYLANIEK